LDAILLSCDHGHGRPLGVTVIYVKEIPPQRKPPSFSKDLLRISKDESDEMDGHSAGSTPKMDWTSGDLPTAWKAFRQHCKFTFKGPLKRNSREEKCNYLMIWIGDEGCNIYDTWELTAEDAKKLDAY